jgi:FKBP12-rapamycin complex-associated protein
LQWAQSAKDPDEGDRYSASIASISYLREFTNELASDIGIGAVDAHGHMIVPDDKIYGEYTDLLAQCHVELGQWQASLKVPGEPVSPLPRRSSLVLTRQWDPTDLILDYKIATDLSPNWYKAWHAWALSNFEVITQLETSHDGLSTLHFVNYIIPAVQGFLRSISLSPGNALQDTLRLLTLWFDYGYHTGVNQTISAGLHTVSIDVWLEVIPQVSQHDRHQADGRSLLVSRLPALLFRRSSSDCSTMLEKHILKLSSIPSLSPQSRTSMLERLWRSTSWLR